MNRAFLVAALLSPAIASAQISFEPETAAPAVAPTPPVDEGWAKPQLSFRLNTRLYVSTTFPGGDENVADWYRFATASFRTEWKGIRVLISARLRWDSVEEAPTKGVFWLFNGTKARSEFEPSLGETSISGTLWGIDWSAGMLDIAWGQNAAFAPADVLNPIDMRDGPILTPDQRIPIPAVRLRGSVGIFSWDAAWLPVFMQSQLPVIGNNWSPYAVAMSPAIPDLQNYVDPTTYAALNSNLIATKYPQLDLTAPQGGVRFSLHPGPLTMAVTWANIFDRQPLVQVSNDFRSLISAVQSGNQLGELISASALQTDLQNGVAPLTATYLRTNIFAFDAALSTGPVRWTLDALWSPARVVPLLDLTSEAKPMGQGVFGFEWEGPPIIGAGVYGILAQNVLPGERLLYFDTPSTPAERERDDWLALGYLAVREMLLDDRLELALTGLCTFTGDFMALPAVRWHIRDAHSLGLGANLIGGPAGSFGAAYSRNDEVFVEYVLTL